MHYLEHGRSIYKKIQEAFRFLFLYERFRQRKKLITVFSLIFVSEYLLWEVNE